MIDNDQPLLTEIAIVTSGNVDSGKCFGRGTLIMKYDGSVIPVENICPGDKLMGDDSTIRTVKSIHTGYGPMYSVAYENTSFLANGEHILCLKYNKSSGNITEYSSSYMVEYLVKCGTTLKPQYKSWSVIKYGCKEAALREAKLFVSTNIIEISINEYLALEPDYKKLLNGYRVGTTWEEIPCDISDFVKILDSDNKHIPELFKFNSHDVRLSVWDQILNFYNKQISPNTDMTLEIPVENSRLIADIEYLCRSIGLTVQINEIITKNSTVIINISETNLTYPITINPYYPNDYYGFELEENPRFLLGDFTVGHNSTFVGVMKYGDLDDGNGSARIKVAKHQHEKDSGKTSDISTRFIPCDLDPANPDKPHGVTFVDLCGHEKYLKTTAYGMNGYFPDYAFNIISANRGVMRMTREHLGILFYLEIPTVILITRIDLIDNPEIYANTLSTAVKLCKLNGKKPIILNSDKELKLEPEVLAKKEEETGLELVKLAGAMQETNNIVPILTISCKTGYFLPSVRKFINMIQPRKLWDPEKIDGSVFYIDQVFNPTGVGIVLSGLLKGKPIHIGDTLYLGPYGKEFIPIKIRSIHNDNRELLKIMGDHTRGCIAVSCLDKKIDWDRKLIRRGMVVVSSESNTKNICYRFKASIDILHHSSTIKSGYAPVIHYGSITQSARIIIEADDNEGKQEFRTNDSGTVTFKFKFAPEFVEPFEQTGKYFFFREGTTRGRGKILSIIKLDNDPDARPDE